MKQIQANNWTQAEAKLAKLYPNDYDHITGLIDPQDKHSFHVLMVKRIHKPQSQSYETKIHRIQYNEKQFNKIMKSGTYKYMGYKEVILLHDPSTEPKEVTVPHHEELQIRHDVKQWTAADIEAEVQKRLAERLTELKGETGGTKIVDTTENVVNTKAARTSETIEDEKEPISFNVSRATKAELLAFAEKHNIDLGEANTLATMQPIIKTWLDAYNASI